jgi:heterodisulfide reductase subunit C
MEHLNKYIQRYQEFAKFDDINLEARIMTVPEEKHYWVTELAKKSHEKRVLTKSKKKLKEALTEKLINEGIVTLNKQTLDSLENSEKIDEINEKLHDVEAAINYLEYIVKNVVFIGNDIKNIISWKQLNE